MVTRRKLDGRREPRTRGRERRGTQRHSEKQGEAETSGRKVLRSSIDAAAILMRERRGVDVVQLYRSIQERAAHVSRADSSIRLQSVGADRLDRALPSRPPPISDAGGDAEPNDDGAVAACRADPRTCSRFRRPRTALGCRSGTRACSDRSVISGPTELARASTAGRDRTRCAASAVGRVNGLSV